MLNDDVDYREDPVKGIKKKRGLKPGQTNNPNGRPKNAKNKVSLSTKERIAAFVEDNFNTLIEEINELEPKDKVKAKIELIKLVVARPLAEEESKAIKTQSALFEKLTQPNK